ncbi:MAG: hypothetical protein PUG10_12795 [Lachnospiraceae bacterium]|nr:hypothetical protein [Lachnospiraceae bacterium]
MSKLQTHFKAEAEPDEQREIPSTVKTKAALAYNQNQMALERTDLSKYRTELAFINSKLAVEQTHLSYLRTIVSLIGTGATIIKALPLIGISQTFSTALAIFLFSCAAYFIFKDCTTYPSTKRHIFNLEKEVSEKTKDTESKIYAITQTNPSSKK